MTDQKRGRYVQKNVQIDKRHVEMIAKEAERCTKKERLIVSESEVVRRALWDYFDAKKAEGGPGVGKEIEDQVRKDAESDRAAASNIGSADVFLEFGGN